MGKNSWKTFEIRVKYNVQITGSDRKKGIETNLFLEEDKWLIL